MKWILSKWFKRDQQKQSAEEWMNSYGARKPCRYWEFEKHIENTEKTQHDT